MLVSFAACEDETRNSNKDSGSSNDGGNDSPFVPEYVDLDLPSGTLWATCNVGANSPEEYGDYFAWGETEQKKYYDWSAEGDYKWGVYNRDEAPNYGMTKYNKTDSKTVLEAADDAATANWGSDWRLPTLSELNELRGFGGGTTCTWTTLNGVNGYRITGKNGNSIFLPAAGSLSGTSLENAGSYGYYWSSSIHSRDYSICNANGLCFDSNFDVTGGKSRYHGLSVRPVCSPR